MVARIDSAKSTSSDARHSAKPAVNLEPTEGRMQPSGVMNYGSKQTEYFHGLRRDMIDRLPVVPLSFLEIGCGSGANAAYARETGRYAAYVGVELFPDAAEAAAAQMDQIIVGDIETLQIETTYAPFDVLVMSEVLEHLVDPWTVLRRLRTLLRPGAAVFASSPAVSHHSVIRMLLDGRWDLQDAGVMDRTHLRWFTPSSYAQMFRDCSYQVISVENMRRMSWRGRMAEALLPRRYKHLVSDQIRLQARAA